VILALIAAFVAGVIFGMFVLGLCSAAGKPTPKP
jgi:hypothetical protein